MVDVVLIRGRSLDPRVFPAEPAAINSRTASVRPRIEAGRSGVSRRLREEGFDFRFPQLKAALDNPYPKRGLVP